MWVRIAAFLLLTGAFAACDLLEEEVDPAAPNYVDLAGSVGDTIVTVEFNRPDEDATFASNVLIIDAGLTQIEESPTGSYSAGTESFEIELSGQTLQLNDGDSDATYDVEISGAVATDGSIVGEIVFTDTSTNEEHVGAIAGGDTETDGETIVFTGDIVNNGTFTSTNVTRDQSNTVVDTSDDSGSYSTNGTFTLSVTGEQFTLTTEATGILTFDSGDPAGPQDFVLLQRIYGNETSDGRYEFTETEQYDSETDEWYVVTGFSVIDADVSDEGVLTVNESNINGGSFDVVATEVVGDVTYTITTTINVTATTFTMDGEELTN